MLLRICKSNFNCSSAILIPVFKRFLSVVLVIAKRFYFHILFGSIGNRNKTKNQFSKMHSRGALIVVEGIDRSGKSTQCGRLIQSLTACGHNVEAMKFPDRGTEIGKMINSYLQRSKDLDDHAVHLLFSANRWEQSASMLDKLRSGVTLIVDRYAYSGVAFTGAKKGFTLDWCKQPDMGLPEPDLVLFLNLSTAEAKKRGGYGDERYEEAEFQRRVHQNFLKLKSKQWKLVDASQSLDKVHSEMLSIVKEVVDNIGDEPIRRLWCDREQLNGHCT